MSLSAEYNCVVVLGPTASGKTRLACELAFRLNGEVISADSRQVYRLLDIGTGKDLQSYSVNGTTIPHHLINIADPREQFYLHQFIEAMHRAFDDITARGRLPVICGGTGMYLDAIRKDFSYTQVPGNESLRNEIKSLDNQELVRRLEKYPAEFVAKVDKTSVKRLIRAIEIGEHLSGNRLHVKPLKPIRPLYIGIDPGKKMLEEQISSRLDQRISQGLVEEARALLDHGISHERLQRLGLEYRFLSALILGEITMAEMRGRLRIAIRQFAKRQMTWFRKMEREGVQIHWQKDAAVSDEMITRIRDSVQGR